MGETIFKKDALKYVQSIIIHQNVYRAHVGVQKKVRVTIVKPGGFDSVHSFA